MQSRYITRRKNWLKYTEETYKKIPDIERGYIEAAIEDYAKICLAERRDQDFDIATHPKWVEYILYVVLTTLGMASFTILPSLVLGEAGIDDNLLLVAVVIIGIVLAWLAHWAVSRFLMEFDLNQKYSSTLSGLEDEFRESGDKHLQKVFILEQQKFLSKKEEKSKNYPSLPSKIFAALVSIFEVGGILYIMYQGDESPNFILVLISSLLPLILLWILAWVKSSLFLVPRACKELRNSYLREIEEINSKFWN